MRVKALTDLAERTPTVFMLRSSQVVLVRCAFGVRVRYNLKAVRSHSVNDSEYKNAGISAGVFLVWRCS